MNKTRSLRRRALFSSLAILFVLISGLALALGGNNRARAVLNGTPINSSDPYPFSSLGLMHASTTVGSCFWGCRAIEEWCGATLVASDWALTAEHCLNIPYNNNLYRATQIKVTFGSTLSNETSGQTMIVDKFVSEPDSDPYNDKNDLMLLHLSKPINGITPLTFGGFCPDWTVGSQVLAAGWGQGRTENAGKRPTNVMQRANLKFAGNMYSLDLNTNSLEYAETTEYLGPELAGFLMFGDSGDGLLFQEPNGHYVLLGVLHRFEPHEPADKPKADIWERTDQASSNFSFIQSTLHLQTFPPPASCTSGPPPLHSHRLLSSRPQYQLVCI